MAKPFILVVEDNPLIVKFYEMSLTRRAGYRVYATEDVDEIVALVKGGQVDVIILDVSLSHAHYQGKKTDGIQIAQLLRGDAATAGVGILIATAHAMEGDRERLLAAAGADDYIEKPIYDASKLIQKIELLLEARRR